MRLLGNICWFIFGGCISGLAWVLSGLVWCVTIVGIPYGLQCFKFAMMSFWPFGRRIVYGGGAVSFIVNVIWFVVNGWWMALGNFVIGLLWCVTIIGIPFGKQFFKIAGLSLRPFGKIKGQFTDCRNMQVQHYIKQTFANNICFI